MLQYGGGRGQKWNEQNTRSKEAGKVVIGVCKPTHIYKGLGALIYKGCICVFKGEGGEGGGGGGQMPPCCSQSNLSYVT